MQVVLSPANDTDYSP